MIGDEPAADGGVKPDDTREQPEVCGNGLDDNGNGFIDDQCSCTPGQRQACWPGTSRTRGVGACTDGVQTCTGADSEFPKWGACNGAILPSPDTSEDGIDQNCDGIGEDDVRCVPTAEQCTGGKDEDCDGKVDCADSDCTSNQACAPRCVPTTEQCTGGKDEDCDGKIDCADSDCTSNQACAPRCVPTTEQCANGRDEDCDGKIDCADPDCASNQACAPPPPQCTPTASWEFCTDGRDNDCDGKTDCDDDECWDSLFCECTEECTPGAVRWCDEEIYCSWGKQTCGPDARWGACTETTSRPQGCGQDRWYDVDCCVAAGQCCQAMTPLPKPYSVGECAPVEVSCVRD